MLGKRILSLCVFLCLVGCEDEPTDIELVCVYDYSRDELTGLGPRRITLTFEFDTADFDYPYRVTGYYLTRSHGSSGQTPYQAFHYAVSPTTITFFAKDLLGDEFDEPWVLIRDGLWLQSIHDDDPLAKNKGCVKNGSYEDFTI